MKHYTYLLFALSTLMIACKESYIANFEPQEAREVNLSLTFETPNYQGYSTTTKIIDPDEKIEDLNIFTIGADSTIITHRYIENYDGSSANIIGITGGCTIAIIANLGEPLLNITNKEELLQVKHISDGSVDKKILTYLSEPYNFDYPEGGGEITIPTIELERLYAKISVTLDFSELRNYVSIIPKTMAIRQVPKSALLFDKNAASSTDQIEEYGKIYSADTTDFTSSSHKDAPTFYIYENAQGVNNESYSEEYKKPLEGTDSLCTYLEITATHIQFGNPRDITYRFWLGKNTNNDFNVFRNRWYKLSLLFDFEGGVDDYNSWRVVTEDMELNIYAPYVEFRTTKYKLQSRVTQAFYLSSSAYAFDYSDNSTFYLTTLGRFTENNFPIGNAELYDDTYINYSVYGMKTNPFFTDVTQLLFPGNHSFGVTDYSITQNLNIITDNDTKCDWKARSTETWLYIGDSKKYAAFTSPGVVGIQGVDGMKSRDDGMLKSTKLSDNSLAVRCLENETGDDRCGYIIFYNTEGDEIGRVLVEQAEKNEVDSPVRIRRFIGLYKMGNFDMLGNPGQYNEYAITKEVYASHETYFLGYTETTMQQYCDFLNDIGIQSTSELGLCALPILDKLGGAENIATDYPGAQYNGQNVEFGFDLAKSSTGAWTPPLWDINKDATSTFDHKISIGNFPLTCINYYNCADYGYWAQKYSGGSYSRQDHPMLPTEAQWESAAKGIYNFDYTIEEYYDNDWQAEVGLYPYALWEGSANNGLTGTQSDISSTKINQCIRHYDNTHNRTCTINFKGYDGIEMPYAPVATLRCNSLDLYDLNGNAIEKTADVGDGGNTTNFPENIILESPVNYESMSDPCNGVTRIAKGGMFVDGKYILSPSYTRSTYKESENSMTGMRIMLSR